MMTELSFLIELLLNHELPKDTKTLIASRIKEVEQKMTTLTFNAPQVNPQFTITSGTNKPQQAPSTMALMAKHGDIPQINGHPVPPPEPVAPLALTGHEMQARSDSMELLKKNKNKPMTTR